MKSMISVFLFLIFISAFHGASAQNTYYQAQWKKVEELAGKKDLPKSALEEVKKIYAQAKKDKQEAQLLKALVFMIGLQQETREEAIPQSIREIEKETATANEPLRSLLNSLQASIYLQYLQQHRYQLYSRTTTVRFQKDDIATWSLEDFHKIITDLYLKSISNAALLKSTKVDAFEPVIFKGNMRYLRPTLFDLLAQEALDYFKSDERDLRRPAYAFEINQPAALATPEQFAAARFSTPDSLSLQHKALLLYQELTRFHLRDNRPDALIDLTLQRISFAYQKGTMENKDSLYTAALQNIRKTYPSNGETAQATFMLAQFYHEKGQRYQAGKDTAYRFASRTALELLEPVVRDSARKSEGWANSYNLLQEIKRPEFLFEVEKVNVPELPFRILVKYKNVAGLSFRVIQLNNKIKQGFQYRYDERYWQTIAAAPAFRTITQSLPATNDFQQHAVEVKMDALPVGEYLLLAENNSTGAKARLMGVQGFSVSNISYLEQEGNYFVLDRETGRPLPGAQVEWLRNTYDYKTGRYQKINAGSGTTDQQGYVPFKPAKNTDDRNYSVSIHYLKDSLQLDESFYTFRSSEEIKQDTTEKTFLFTDRSLYRPGQTVFFKGILIRQLGKTNTLLQGRQTKVYLQNSNGEPVDSLLLTTNEFGSFNGRFSLPRQTLNGQFSIYAKNDYSYFSVEEYKRPKFYVSFEKVQGSYHAGDSIRLQGTAKAYAGNQVSGAIVSYRVVRQPRLLYPWLSRIWLPQSPPAEIAHGSVTTDAAGKFLVHFKAIPDHTLDAANNPLFEYQVFADVTDGNGETRSASEVVLAGYTSLVLKVDLPSRISKDSLRSVSVRTESLSGTFQPSVVSLRATKLVPEQRLLRPRYWEQPDLFLYSREEYIQWFPYDPYSNEQDMSSWKKEKLVLDKKDSTRTNGLFEIKPLDPGFYELVLEAADSEGKIIRDIRYLEVFAPSSPFNKPEFIWAAGGKEIEPGQSTSIEIGSSAKNVFLIQQVQKTNAATLFSFPLLDREKKSFSFSATEEDRGGYAVAFFFVKNNRVYQFSDIIKVPWSNKELAIEWSTFRDKTLPGSQETWKVKISGLKGEKAATELLASMYDASLDQFRPYQWEKPSIWTLYTQKLNWAGSQNFSAMGSEQKGDVQYDYKEFEKRYDQLLFNNMNHFLAPYRGYGLIKQSATKMEGVAASAAPPAPQQASMGNARRDGLTDTSMNEKEEESPAQVLPQLEVMPPTNFNETAFFFPELHTDAEGNVEFSFTTPEALTTWKLQTLAHTKDLSLGINTRELVTQKELMVQPNIPRFLREGDRLELSATISNMGKEEVTGQAQLLLFDATTNESVDGWFQNIFPNQYFTVAAGATEVVRFPVEVPYLFDKALTWRIVARAGNKSDGEEQVIPVLTNKTLVTETIPLPMKGSGSKTFSFDALRNTQSETLQQHSLTVEYTTNPAWLAVQALPYLAEEKNENAEQIWNRYFAHALAKKILASAPRLRAVFEKWQTEDTAALLSNLQKNTELKSVLLQETPWVLQAKTEAEQKRNIALLFQLSQMPGALKDVLEKLKEFQSENGGFVWVKGGPEDRYMTQYIITGIGHLMQLDGASASDGYLMRIASAGISYLDKKTTEDYNLLLRSKAKLAVQQPGNQQIQYLYMRSFFPRISIPKATLAAYQYYKKQAKQSWTKQNKMMQGMTALFLHRTGDQQTAAAILKSLKETAIVHEELGMYWKEQGYGRSWYWWSAPIEMQALMIETFSEAGKDQKTVDALKTWLLRNKQTNNWKTTRATAEACFALLLQGSDWISSEPVVEISLGSTVVKSTDAGSEAGTGYFSKTFPAQSIQPDMGKIKVSVGQAAPTTPSWGAVYWQYFENLDKISNAATPLQLSKKLFVQKATDRGPVLSPLNDGDAVQVGDKITVRVELRADRDMEYVHMKDLRAAALEPVEVLSGYRWQGGLGYYQSVTDAATQFYFNYLRKGTYVFEYSLFATHSGNFSNGITTIQCLYAPEFAAHSEGVRINIEQR